MSKNVSVCTASVQIVLSFLIAVPFFILLSMYFNGPTIQVDMDTGVCIRAKGPLGKIPCDLAMQMKFKNIVKVDPHKNNSQINKTI